MEASEGEKDAKKKGPFGDRFIFFLKEKCWFVNFGGFELVSSSSSLERRVEVDGKK
jgi:hypothetical protein